MKPLIYIALDMESWSVAKQFIDKNHLHGLPVKVGMELFYREGPAVIEKLKENNHPIFLDLKLHDIPATVMKAMRNIAALEVDMVNIHALGGRDMMHAAKEGLLQGSTTQKPPLLVAVTILTSITNDVLEDELALSRNVTDQAVRLASMAQKSGVDGVVCSAHEAFDIKEVCGKQFITVTPGIRLTSTSHHDQKRVMTPGQARENQADILVIGRSITTSDEPLEVYNKAKKEWEHAT